LPALDDIAEPPVTVQDRRDRFRRSIEWLLTTLNRLQLAAKVSVHERGLPLFSGVGQAS
jgi:hypothetical protein